ncbi:DUF4013 domain-containing protein [Methanobrevibacter sp. DSM 116169]|uniref:DUF4013 domain-containing protein n=1 Tax=Methanobrevibacter sp. DSM 116169 TaxID=3242727 RepID=UPI0038FCE5CC
MIFEIYQDSIGYIIKDKKILNLGIISILSFLIIPIIILAGYSYRTTEISLESMVNLNKKKPSFKNIKELLSQGIKVIIVTLIYSIPLFIAAYLLSSIDFIIRIVETSGMSTIEFNLEFIGILAIISFISFLFISVAIPIMINNNGSLKSAFKIKEIIKIIKNVEVINYLKFIILLIITFIGILILIFLVGQILINLIAITGFLIPGHAVILFYIAIGMFFVIPAYILCESRAIGLIYNMGS